MNDSENESRAMPWARGVRDWLNNHAAATTVAIVVVLLLSLAVMGKRLQQILERPAVRVYFYDVVTKQVIEGKATDVSPIVTAEGHEAVRVHVFSCADCTAEERFAGYYEKFTPEAKAVIEHPSPTGITDPPFNRLLYCAADADPADPKSWVSSSTPEGKRITDYLEKKCGARPMRNCQ